MGAGDLKGMKTQPERILIIEPSMETKSVLTEVLHEYSVMFANNAQEAIRLLADDQEPHIRVVLLDLSLAGHSGFEFIYELRTYADWDAIRLVVFSGVDLGDEVLRSRAWQQLKIAKYLYKPQVHLEDLHSTIQELVYGS